MSTGNGPQPTSPLWISDEQIAIYAGGDFVTLCPAYQQTCWGNDGYFNANDQWTLNSNVVNFQQQGLGAQSVLILRGAPQFPGQGHLFAVDSVSGTSAVLRRIGGELGFGQPPSPVSGSTGIEFEGLTFGAQIDAVCYRLKEQFSIDEAIFYRSSAWVYQGAEDAYRIFRDVAVFMLLRDAYEREARNGDGDFERKAAIFSKRYREAEAKAYVRWGPLGNAQEPTNVGSARLSR